jgi:hypothetical protein
MAHFPAGASLQSIMHYAQVISSKKLSKYDYGTAAANQAKYG